MRFSGFQMGRGPPGMGSFSPSICFLDELRCRRELRACRVRAAGSPEATHSPSSSTGADAKEATGKPRGANMGKGHWAQPEAARSHSGQLAPAGKKLDEQKCKERARGGFGKLEWRVGKT